YGLPRPCAPTTPTTATSFTAGWCSRQFSTSCGASHLPETLSRSSARPQYVKYPSGSRRTISPDTYHSPRNPSLVFSICCQYPIAREPPRTHSAPTSPAGSSRPSSSHTLTSKPGTTVPSVPGRTCPGRFGEQHGGRADGEGKQQVGAGRVPEVELGHADGHIALGVSDDPFGIALGRVREGGVGLHHGLRLPCGSTREEPDRRVVAVSR